MKLTKEDYKKYIVAEFMLKRGKPELMIRLEKENEKKVKYITRCIINSAKELANYRKKVLYEIALDYASK